MTVRVDGVAASYPQRRRSYATVVTEWASWVPVVSVVCRWMQGKEIEGLAEVAGWTGGILPPEYLTQHCIPS